MIAIYMPELKEQIHNLYFHDKPFAKKRKMANWNFYFIDNQFFFNSCYYDIIITNQEVQLNLPSIYSRGKYQIVSNKFEELPNLIVEFENNKSLVEKKYLEIHLNNLYDFLKYLFKSLVLVRRYTKGKKIKNIEENLNKCKLYFKKQTVDIYKDIYEEIYKKYLETQKEQNRQKGKFELIWEIIVGRKEEDFIPQNFNNLPLRGKLDKYKLVKLASILDFSSALYNYVKPTAELYEQTKHMCVNIYYIYCFQDFMDLNEYKKILSKENFNQEPRIRKLYDFYILGRKTAAEILILYRIYLNGGADFPISEFKKYGINYKKALEYCHDNPKKYINFFKF